MPEKNKDYNDSIDYSDNAREIGELMHAINSLQDIRNGKIESAKKAIESGRYRADSFKIAKKLLEEGVF